MKSRRGRPRALDADVAILDAARRLLAERGFARMTVDAVAEAAGVTKPTIYLRWKSKADLATAALARIQAEEPAVATGDPRRDLVQTLRNFQASLFRPNGMAMIGTLLVEEREMPELMAAFRERIVATRRALVRAPLEAARGRGLLREDADLDAAVNLLIGSFYARYLAGGPAPRDWPERVVGVVWEGIARPQGRTR